MKTKTLKTGVKVTFNDRDEIISVSSPYDNDTTKLSVLQYLKKQIKHIIRPNHEYYNPDMEWWNGKIK